MRERQRRPLAMNELLQVVMLEADEMEVEKSGNKSDLPA